MGSWVWPLAYQIKTLNKTCKLRVIVEQIIEWKIPLYMCFVDFEKTFHNIRTLNILLHYDVPIKMFNVIKNYMKGFHSCQIVNNGSLWWIRDLLGVRLGCLLLTIPDIIQPILEGRMGGQKTERETKTDLVQQHNTMDRNGSPEMHCRGYRPSPVECHYMSTSSSEMTLPGIPGIWYPSTVTSQYLLKFFIKRNFWKKKFSMLVLSWHIRYYITFYNWDEK